MLKFFSERLNLMSLLNNGAVISHLVVMVLFHDIQLTSCIRDSKLGFERIPHIFTDHDSHEWIDNLVAKNTQGSTSEEGVCSLESLFLLSSQLSLWLAFRGVKTVHGGKPKNCPRTPPLIGHALKWCGLESCSKSNRRNNLHISGFWIVEKLGIFPFS